MTKSRLPSLRVWLMLVFWPLTAFILWLDGSAVSGGEMNGQFFANLLAPLFLALLVAQLPPPRRLSALLFVPLSAFGEWLFSIGFGLYDYRLGEVPIYVPFGHAILLSIGLLLAESEFVRTHERRLRLGLASFHFALILAAWLWLGDVLSLLWGAAFAVLFFSKHRSAQSTFPLILGVLVLYIELLGTRFGCWNWKPLAWNLVPTWNPPVGAFACYVVGDLHALSCARRLQNWWDARTAATRGLTSLPGAIE
jgi:hypothetical protein